MSNNNMREDVTIAKNSEELLSYSDERFVKCAFLTLLGRTPDPEGMAYYCGRLRLGYSKAKIISQITASEDARKFGADLPGLRDLVATQKRNDHWFWGFLSRGKRMELQANRMELELVRLSRQMVAITDYYSTFEHPEKIQMTSTEGNLLNTEYYRNSSPPYEPDISSLSLSARDIYAVLAKAITAVKEEDIIK